MRRQPEKKVEAKKSARLLGVGIEGKAEYVLCYRDIERIYKIRADRADEEDEGHEGHEYIPVK